MTRIGRIFTDKIMPLKHETLTGQIIKSFYKVYNELGYGFLEKVYENALALELMAAGLLVQRPQPTPVYYFGRQVGDYYADLVVQSMVIIENVRKGSAMRLKHSS